MLLPGAGLLAITIAIVLGLLAPPASSGSGDARAAINPQLIVSQFSDAESTLWLVDPADPTQRQRLFALPHAPGWAVAGATSPDGDRLALLVVPAGAGDPDASARLLLSDGGTPTTLAEGLDLRGGLVWSADGAQILARRGEGAGDGRRVTAIVSVDVESGVERTLLRWDAPGAVYPLGRPAGGPSYAVSVGSGGSQLLTIEGDAVTTRPLSPDVTRDWAISPDGERLAFTEQQGLALRVMVASLQDAVLAAAQAPPEETDAGTPGGSASPAWRADGELSVGRFDGPATIATARAGDAGEGPAEGGFQLPASWSPDGAYLALRVFDGAGPGAPGAESVAVAAGEMLRPVTGPDLRIIGWWHASP